MTDKFEKENSDDVRWLDPYLADLAEEIRIAGYTPGESLERFDFKTTRVLSAGTTLKQGFGNPSNDELDAYLGGSMDDEQKRRLQEKFVGDPSALDALLRRAGVLPEPEKTDDSLKISFRETVVFWVRRAFSARILQLAIPVAAVLLVASLTLMRNEGRGFELIAGSPETIARVAAEPQVRFSSAALTSPPRGGIAGEERTSVSTDRDEVVIALQWPEKKAKWQPLLHHRARRRWTLAPRQKTFRIRP
jgi:hypothetical protein